MKSKAEIDVVSLLKAGREHAITSAELAEMTGADLRSIRGIIEDSRNNGQLIVACSEGYYLPETPEEAAAWLRMAGAKARAIFRTMQGARKWLRVQGWYLPSGQLSFDDLESMVMQSIDDDNTGYNECG